MHTHTHTYIQRYSVFLFLDTRQQSPAAHTHTHTQGEPWHGPHRIKQPHRAPRPENCNEQKKSKDKQCRRAAASSKVDGSCQSRTSQERLYSQPPWEWSWCRQPTCHYTISHELLAWSVVIQEFIFTFTFAFAFWWIDRRKTKPVQVHPRIWMPHTWCGVSMSSCRACSFTQDANLIQK